MRKLTSILLCTAMVFTMAACTGEQNKTEQPTGQTPASTTVRIAGLKGPTTMGMLHMLEENEINEAGNNYEFTLANTTDEITGSIIKGEYDIAAIPLNLASVLYNKTQGDIQLVFVNTLNVLYIVEKGGDSVNSVTDLKGKTILATSKGATPDFTLRYILEQNSIDPEKDLTLDFKAEPSEVAALLMNGKAQYAMLPQPFVSTVLAQDKDIRVAVNLQDEWDKIDAADGSKIATACIIVQRDFATSNPEAVKKFMQDYAASVEKTNADIPATAALCEKYGIIAKKEIAEKAIPECNIVAISGEEMKTIAMGYLTVLHQQNPQSVGVTLPGDNFFYYGK